MSTKFAIRGALAAGLLGLVALIGVSGCGSTPTETKKDVGTAGKYAFWPLAPAEPRIQYIGSYNSSEDVSKTEASGLEKAVFGRDAEQVAYVNKPYGLIMHDGKIYICDIRGKSVVVMDLARKQTRLMGTTGVNKLERPVAITIGDDGEIYVADGVYGAIMIFDKSERFSRAIKIEKFKPASMATFGERLYIADITRQQILILDRKSGKELGVIGSVGDEPGQFRLPIGVTVDKSGNVYVTDMMRCMVQKFDKDGKYLSGFGRLGDHAGSFARPKHVAVDSDGIIYVVDAQFQNVQMFNDEFKLLMFFGSPGKHPGAMSLPVGIAVTDQGLDYFKDKIYPGFEAKRLVLVANQFGDGRVSVYAMGGLRSGYTIEQVAAVSEKVSVGVQDTPSAETLKFQNIGGVEPTPEGAVQDEPLGDSAQPAEPQPQTPPANPKP
ncbi:MAG: hypothetical protein IT432_08445 [Phycisphaerales bacterium]|nr:hypothetical protein [Phycisphaerales bacterium]